MTDRSRPRVVIAGGGPAAVEALLALSDVAAGRVAITLLLPDPVLELRALTVASPFAQGRERRRFPIADLADRAGAEIVEDTLAEVAGGEREVITGSGARIPYDHLLVAVGARPRAPFEHALTFGEKPLALNGLLADIEEGYSQRLAFVVPSGVCWPLPAYELALMTRKQATSMGMDPQISVVTPEASPLAVFGRRASHHVAELFEAAGIDVRTGVHAAVGPSGRITLSPGGETLEPQRIVALPLVDGPRIPGLPHDQDGFVPIDEHAGVLDMPGVYCAGDAANYPIKQGGLATQQADAAALHIAHEVGARVKPAPFRPVLRGRLMTGGAEQFFVKDVGRPAGRQSETPLWWPPTKVSGRYLTPWLSTMDPGALPPEPEADTTAIEAEMPSDPSAARRALLALSPLGAPPEVHRY
jgi:sulfide:quinone oxidoreductase